MGGYRLDPQRLRGHSLDESFSVHQVFCPLAEARRRVQPTPGDAVRCSGPATAIPNTVRLLRALWSKEQLRIWLMHLSKVLLPKKPVVTHIVSNFFALCGIWEYIAVFARFFLCFESDERFPPFTVIICPYLCPGLPHGLLLSDLTT